MIYRKGDMFRVLDPDRHVLCVTTNATINRRGELVMGRGAALAAKKRFPGVEKLLAQEILRYTNPKRYGATIVIHGVQRIIAVQVKREWYNVADLELIRYGISFVDIAAKMAPDMTFRLNYPGIGNGGLKPQDVKPVLDPLPDNVEVWSL